MSVCSDLHSMENNKRKCRKKFTPIKLGFDAPGAKMADKFPVVSEDTDHESVSVPIGVQNSPLSKRINEDMLKRAMT